MALLCRTWFSFLGPNRGRTVPLAQRRVVQREIAVAGSQVELDLLIGLALPHLLERPPGAGPWRGRRWSRPGSRSGRPGGAVAGRGAGTAAPPRDP